MMRTCTDISTTPPPARLDQRGASILIALFFFLVCTVVGGVVLTAATVTSGQLVALEKSQQAYYSATSAAELMRDAIVDGTCGSGGAASTVWTCTLPVIEGAGQAASTGTSNGGQTLAAQLAVAVSAIQSGASSWALDGVVISLAPNEGDAVLNVLADIRMNQDCSLSIALRPQNYDEAVGAYKVLCSIPAALQYKEDEATVEQVKWERAIITKGSQAEGA